MKSWGPRMRWAGLITIGLIVLVAVFMVWAGAQWGAKVNELRTVTPLSDEELSRYKRSLEKLANELGVSQVELVDFGKTALSIGPRGREGFEDIVRATQVAHVVLGLTKQEASTLAVIVVRDLGFAPSKLMNFTSMLREAQSQGMAPQESIQFLAGISDSFRTMHANYGWNEEAMDRAITGFMGTALALRSTQDKTGNKENYPASPEAEEREEVSPEPLKSNESISDDRVAKVYNTVQMLVEGEIQKNPLNLKSGRLPVSGVIVARRVDKLLLYGFVGSPAPHNPGEMVKSPDALFEILHPTPYGFTRDGQAYESNLCSRGSVYLPQLKTRVFLYDELCNEES